MEEVPFIDFGYTSVMDPETQTRTQRRAAETRRSVVEAAQAILASEGPAGFTIEAVAERADVAVQTIYNRVGGRTALLNAVAEIAQEENRVYMDAAYAADGTPRELLELVAAAYVSFARERPHEFRLLAEPPDDPTTLQSIGSLIGNQNAKLAALLRDAIADGTGRPEIDPDRAATSLWAMMNGLLALSWRADNQRLDPEELDKHLETFLEIALHGLIRPT